MAPPLISFVEPQRGFAATYKPSDRKLIRETESKLSRIIITFHRKLGQALVAAIGRNISIDALNKAWERLQVSLLFADKVIETLTPIWIQGAKRAEQVMSFQEPEKGPTRTTLAAMQALRKRKFSTIAGLSYDLRTRLAETVASMYAAGASMDKIRDAIMKETDMFGQRKAMTIARTETIFAYNAGHYETIDSNPLITHVEWVDGQPGACPRCLELDGVRVAKGSTFPDTSILHPPLHPNCRCAIAGVVVPGTMPRPAESPLTVEKLLSFSPSQEVLAKLHRELEGPKLKPVPRGATQKVLIPILARYRRVAQAIAEAYRELGVDVIWNGRIYTMSHAFASASKADDCSIRINKSVLHQVRRNATRLVHEVAHAVYDNDWYKRTRWGAFLEELSAETIARMMTKRLGLSSSQGYSWALPTFKLLAKLFGKTPLELAVWWKSEGYRNDFGLVYEEVVKTVPREVLEELNPYHPNQSWAIEALNKHLKKMRKEH